MRICFQQVGGIFLLGFHKGERNLEFFVYFLIRILVMMEYLPRDALPMALAFRASFGQHTVLDVKQLPSV